MRHRSISTYGKTSIIQMSDRKIDRYKFRY